MAAVCDAELTGLRFETGAEGPVADEQEVGVAPRRTQDRERTQEVVGPFDLRHPPEPADEEPIVGEAELPA